VLHYAGPPSCPVPHLIGGINKFHTDQLPLLLGGVNVCAHLELALGHPPFSRTHSRETSPAEKMGAKKPQGQLKENKGKLLNLRNCSISAQTIKWP